MNNNKSIRTRILGIFQSLLNPVISELPFFALFLFAISVMSLRFFPSPLLHWATDLVRDFLWSNFPRAGAVMSLRFFPSPLNFGVADMVKEFLWANFPRAGAIAYLFTLVVYLTRSRVVRIVEYAFAAMLFTVVLFLYFVFRKQLQPDVIMLVGETNPSESQEFLSSFLFSPGGIITMLCLVVYVAMAFFLDRRRKEIAVKWMRLKYRKILNVMMIAFVLLGFYQFRLFGDILTHKNIDEIKWGGTRCRFLSVLFPLQCPHCA